MIDLIKFVVGSNARTWRLIALMICGTILAAVVLGAAVWAGQALGLVGTAVVGGAPTLAALIVAAVRRRRKDLDT